MRRIFVVIALLSVAGIAAAQLAYQTEAVTVLCLPPNLQAVDAGMVTSVARCGSGYSEIRCEDVNTSNTVKTYWCPSKGCDLTNYLTRAWERCPTCLHDVYQQRAVMTTLDGGYNSRCVSGGADAGTRWACHCAR